LFCILYFVQSSCSPSFNTHIPQLPIFIKFKWKDELVTC
jgi:hypothetical protein